MKIVKPSFKLIVIALACFVSLGFIGTKVIGFINPAVADLDMNGYNIIIDADGDSYLDFGTDDTIKTYIGGIETFKIDSSKRIFYYFAGIERFRFESNSLAASTPNGGEIKNVVSSATLPVHTYRGTVSNKYGLGGDPLSGYISLITNSIEAFRLSEAAGTIINSSFGNLAMGANFIGYDGVVNEGWSFDTAGNITFGSAGSYLDMGGKNITLGAGWFGRAASAVTFDATENVVITVGLFLGTNGIGNDDEVLTFAAGATGTGTFAGALDVGGDIGLGANGIGNNNSVLTFAVGATGKGTFAGAVDVTGDLKTDGAFSYGSAVSLTISGGAIAVTKSYHTIVVEGGTGSGNDALTTATGGAEGDTLILMAATSGELDTITVTDGAGADTFILAGGVNFDLNTINDRIVLLHNGTEWVELSRSDN